MTIALNARALSGILAVAALIVPTSARSQQLINEWTGNGTSVVWSGWSDLAKKTRVMGVEERCISGAVYVRFRNNDPSGDTLRFSYAFGPTNSRPTGTSHDIELRAREESKAIFVPAVSCDITAHPYTIYFYSAR